MVASRHRIPTLSLYGTAVCYVISVHSLAAACAPTFSLWRCSGSAAGGRWRRTDAPGTAEHHGTQACGETRGVSDARHARRHCRRVLGRLLTPVLLCSSTLFPATSLYASIEGNSKRTARSNSGCIPGPMTSVLASPEKRTHPPHSAISSRFASSYSAYAAAPVSSDARPSSYAACGLNLTARKRGTEQGQARHGTAACQRARSERGERRCRRIESGRHALRLSI